MPIGALMWFGGHMNAKLAPEAVVELSVYFAVMTTSRTLHEFVRSGIKIHDHALLNFQFRFERLQSVDAVLIKLGDGGVRASCYMIL
jgi:hypothetical protein